MLSPRRSDGTQLTQPHEPGRKADHNDKEKGRSTMTAVRMLSLLALLALPNHTRAQAIPAEAAADEASPIDDVRASAWYRVEMVRNLVRRGLQAIAAQGGEA